MTADAEVMTTQSALLGRLVINPETAETIGRIDHLWLDVRSHKVLGFTTKAGTLGLDRHRFSWEHICSIGAEGVMVNLPSAGEPAKIDAITNVIGHELWSDTGSRAGVVMDYRLHLRTGNVVDYLFSTDGWGGLSQGIYCLPPATVISGNHQRLVASANAISSAGLYSPGLSQKVAGVGDFLKSDYDRTKQDVTSVVQGTQAIANQVKAKLTGLADTVQEGTQSLTDQAKTKLSDTASQLQQTSEQVTAQAKDQLDQLQQRTQAAADQTQAGLSGLVNKAQDKLSDVKQQLQNRTASESDSESDSEPVSDPDTDTPAPPPA